VRFFSHRFSIWQDQLAARADVFLGYSSKARATAQAVHIFLKERLNLKIRNWELDFAAAGNILDEIEIAARLCTGGIFLFTTDDAQPEGDATRAAPRDNVVFEAGFFAAARGRGRVLIIREEGAKMPTGLGGNIYLSLRDRNEVGQIESGIRDFVEKRL
jgi:predicted nucleotide-binding protein